MTSRRRHGLAGALVVLVLTACTPDQPGPDRPTQDETTSQPPTEPSLPEQTPPRTITIAVAGDVHFEGVLRERLGDPSSALAPATNTLAAADVAIVNLETSIGEGGAPEPGKRYTFQAPPTAFQALAAAGIDVATMANNHALDYGREPLPGTFVAIERAQLDVVGIGPDADAAFAPAVTDIDGTRVATIGATTAGTDPTADPTAHWAATDHRAGTADAIDPVRLLRAVRRADRSADVVVTYLHWGIQGQGCPSRAQQDLAADLVEAGADIVVGSHTHRLQGAGSLGEGYVAYGLGNFAWYTQGPDTGVLTLTVRPPTEPGGRARVTREEWTGARIGADGLPAVLRGADADVFADELVGLRDCAGLDRVR